MGHGFGPLMLTENLDCRWREGKDVGILRRENVEKVKRKSNLSCTILHERLRLFDPKDPQEKDPVRILVRHETVSEKRHTKAQECHKIPF